jgi:hypothetical protein
MTIDLNHIYITEKSASKTCRLHREIMEGEGEAMKEELGVGRMAASSWPRYHQLYHHHHHQNFYS